MIYEAANNTTLILGTAS